MIREYMMRVRSFNRNVRLMLVASTFIGFVNFGVMGVVFNLYLLRLNYGPRFIGVVWAIFAASWALFSLPAGAVGRRWGVRRAMILGMVAVPFAAALFPFTQSVPETARVPWLITSCLLWGAGFAFYLVNAVPFLAAATGDAERAHAFSVYLALIPLAGFVGSFIGGALPGLCARWLTVSLESPEPFRYPLWLGAILYLPITAALLATRDVTVVRSPEAQRAEGRAPVAILAVLGVVTFLTKAAAAAPQNFFNVYLDDALHQLPSRIGALSAVAQLGGALSVLLAPVLMERYGKRRTYIGAASFAALSIVPLALVPHWVAAGIGYAGLYMGAMIVDAAFNVISQAVVEPGWRPVASGIGFTAEGLSRTLIALAGGLAIVAFGYRTMFLIVAAIAAAAGAVFWAYFRKPRGVAAESG
jgi:MFS family permease